MFRLTNGHSFRSFISRHIVHTNSQLHTNSFVTIRMNAETMSRSTHQPTVQFNDILMGEISDGFSATSSKIPILWLWSACNTSTFEPSSMLPQPHRDEHNVFLIASIRPNVSDGHFDTILRELSALPAIRSRHNNSASRRRRRNEKQQSVRWSDAHLSIHLASQCISIDSLARCIAAVCEPHLSIRSIPFTRRFVDCLFLCTYFWLLFFLFFSSFFLLLSGFTLPLFVCVCPAATSFYVPRLAAHTRARPAST